MQGMNYGSKPKETDVLNKNLTLGGSPALICLPIVSGNRSVANCFDLAFARSYAL